MLYSFKDFTGHDLTLEDIPSGTVIEGSCFSREQPDSLVFPNKMTGVTFIDCNLDNCFIPPGNAIKGGSQKRFESQNDNHDWELDLSNTPIRPVNYITFQKKNLPLPDPKDIPVQKSEAPIDLIAIQIAKKAGP